ncbi:MAG: hypothetical protein AB1540_00485 [Bdellovibrionota bacterium]
MKKKGVSKNTPLVLVLFAVILAGSGCFRAENRKAPKENIEPARLESLPGGTEAMFTKNSFFLWKEKPHPNQIATVRRKAKDIDQADARAGRISALLGCYDRKLGKIDEKLKQLLEPVDADLASAAENFAAVMKSLGELPLTEARDEKEREVATQLETELAEYQETLKKAPDEAQQLLKERELIYGNWSKKQQENLKNSDESTDFVRAVKENTEYMDGKPEKVVLNIYPDGRFDIHLIDWPLKGISHTPETGTIYNTSYESNGGELRFEVVTAPGEVYKFRLSCNKVGANRNCEQYQGDMDRYRDGVLEREGVAKLSNVPQVQVLDDGDPESQDCTL